MDIFVIYLDLGGVYFLIFISINKLLLAFRKKILNQ